MRNGNAETPQRGKPWPAGWYRSKTGVQWSTAKSVSPSHSLCIIDDPAAKQEVAAWRSVAANAVPGTTYALTWSWQHIDAKNVSAQLRFQDGAGKPLTRKVSNAVGSNSAFQKLTIRAVAPAGATAVDVLFTRAAGGSGTVYFDDVNLTDEPTVTRTSGDVP